MLEVSRVVCGFKRICAAIWLYRVYVGIGPLPKGALGYNMVFFAFKGIDGVTVYRVYVKIHKERERERSLNTTYTCMYIYVCGAGPQGLGFGVQLF